MDRETYATGAHRSSADGKGRPEMLPGLALLRLGLVYEKGSKAHGPWNMRLGMDAGRLCGSRERHGLQYQAGLSDEDHLAQSVWNGLELMELEERLARREADPALWTMPWDFDRNGVHIDGTVTKLRKQREAERTAPSSLTGYVIYDPTKGPPPTPPIRRRHTVYVGGPFSAPTPGAKHANCLHASNIALRIAQRGHLVHCPHNATGPWDGQLPYEWFMALDLKLLGSGAFDTFYYIGSSPGTDRELAVATQMGLTIWRNLDDVPDLTPGEKRAK